MMKLFSLIFILLFSSLCFGCEIQTYSKIYKINKIMDDAVIKSSSCPKNVENKFLNLIASGQGNIKSAHLSRVLSNKDIGTITIKPKAIEVESLINKMQVHFNDPSLSFSNLSALYPYSAILGNEDQNISFECKNCNSSGRKNIKVVLGKESVWLSASLNFRIKALRLKRNLSYHTPLLTKGDFEIVETLEKDPSQIFTDLDNIQYFKLSRNVVQGRVLKVHDLRPKNLITIGQKIQVHLTNKSVQLKTVGIAKKSGKYGDYIEIENPKSKKIIMGKVTGHNSASVDI